MRRRRGPSSEAFAELGGAPARDHVAPQPRGVEASAEFRDLAPRLCAAKSSLRGKWQSAAGAGAGAGHTAETVRGAAEVRAREQMLSPKSHRRPRKKRYSCEHGALNRETVEECMILN